MERARHMPLPALPPLTSTIWLRYSKASRPCLRASSALAAGLTALAASSTVPLMSRLLRTNFTCSKTVRTTSQPGHGSGHA